MLFLSFRIYENRFVAAAVNFFGERYGFFWRALRILLVSATDSFGGR